MILFAQSMSTSGAVGPGIFLFLLIISFLLFGGLGSLGLFISFKFFIKKATQFWMYISFGVFSLFPGFYALVKVLFGEGAAWFFMCIILELVYIILLSLWIYNRA